MQDAGYRRIPVKAGDVTLHALVSPEDYEALAAHRWSLNHPVGEGYAARTVYHPRKATVLMSREILGLQPGDGLEADHINRDKLDNRRANLRTVTRPENMRNRGSFRGSTSPYRGVCWHSRHGKWQAQAKFDRVKYYLGMHADEVNAARAVNAFWVERGYPAPNDLAA